MAISRWPWHPPRVGPGLPAPTKEVKLAKQVAVQMGLPGCAPGAARLLHLVRTPLPSAGSVRSRSARLLSGPGLLSHARGSPSAGTCRLSAKLVESAADTEPADWLLSMTRTSGDVLFPTLSSTSTPTAHAAFLQVQLERMNQKSSLSNCPHAHSLKSCPVHPGGRITVRATALPTQPRSVLFCPNRCQPRLLQLPNRERVIDRRGLVAIFGRGHGKAQDPWQCSDAVPRDHPGTQYPTVPSSF